MLDLAIFPAAARRSERARDSTISTKINPCRLARKKTACLALVAREAVQGTY
jgi:hypothetical protein